MSDENPTNDFTADEIATLEREHEDLLVLRDPFDEDERRFTFILRPAEPLVWREFETTATNEEKQIRAMPGLVKACVVACAFKGERGIGKEAARPIWDKLLKRYSAAASGSEIVKAVMRFNGAAKADRGK